MSDSESPVELVLPDGRAVCCDNELDCEPLDPESICGGKSLCDVSIAEDAPCWVPLAKSEDKVGPPVAENCDGDSSLVENTPKPRDIEIPADVEIPVGIEIPVNDKAPGDVGELDVEDVSDVLVCGVVEKDGTTVGPEDPGDVVLSAEDELLAAEVLEEDAAELLLGPDELRLLDELTALVTALEE